MREYSSKWKSSSEAEPYKWYGEHRERRIFARNVPRMTAW